jgi:hypothetical protein
MEREQGQLFISGRFFFEVADKRERQVDVVVIRGSFSQSHPRELLS